MPSQTNRRAHWESVYADRTSSELGWYTPHLQLSCSWIRDLDLAPQSPIIDVGGGASTLVDDLLREGYQAITVLDIAERALSTARERLGENAVAVTWLHGDVTAMRLATNCYELWHDRAVFHFLTDPDHQRKYRDNLLRALRKKGHLIIGTFAPEAPARCSGLPVRRYSAESLCATLGEEFSLVQHQKELHVTPGGVEQMYLYCQFRVI